MSNLSNIDEVMASMGRAILQRKIRVVEIVNRVPYAIMLNRRDGYWVMDGETATSIAKEKMQELLREGELITDDSFNRAARDTGKAIVQQYQKVIGTTDRPGRSMAPPRPLHPGNWADDTVTLVKGYRYSIDGGAERSVTYTA